MENQELETNMMDVEEIKRIVNDKYDLSNIDYSNKCKMCVINTYNF